MEAEFTATSKETGEDTKDTILSSSYPSTLFDDSVSENSTFNDMEYPSTSFGESFEECSRFHESFQFGTHFQCRNDNEVTTEDAWCSTPSRPMPSKANLPHLNMECSPVRSENDIGLKQSSPVHLNSEGTSPALQSIDFTENLNSPKKGKTKAKGKSRKLFWPDLTEQRCCRDECLGHITASTLKRCNDTTELMTKISRKQYVLEQLRLQKNVAWEGKSYKVVGSFVLSGRRVCDKSWCILHNVSDSIFRECLRRFSRGKVNVFHRNTRKKKKMEKTTEALGWMRLYFMKMGDYMPHKAQIHLPVSYTKKSLYEKMIREFKERGLGDHQMISYEHFTAIWKSELPQFIIPKVSEFTKCSVCTELDEALEKGGNSEYMRNIRKLRDKHLAIVELERAEYHSERARARRESSEVTCIIIDGMDQSKTSLPHFVTSDKNTNKLAFLPVHVTGVLVHTSVPSGKIPIVFLDYKEIPHDSNLTANVLLKALERTGGKLGKTLFLQLDNCYRENKNRYLLSLCSLLVELDVFIEITVHFLPVGHTHEDIDQLFRCIAGSLRTRNAYTIEDLANIIKESYNPIIEVSECGFLHNIKEWITPHLAGQFGNHSKPHWFRFNKINGHAVMYYKLWKESQWEPSSGAEKGGLVCLKTVPDVNLLPQWVKPTFEKVDLDGLMKDIPAGYRGRLTSDEYIRSWERFFDQIDARVTVPALPDIWCLQNLKGRCTIMPVEEVVLPDNIAEIEEQLTAETRPVYIGRQGRPLRITDVAEVEERQVSEGMLVAVNLRNTEYTPPHIGKVICVNDDVLKVHWMRGGYSKEWKLWNIRRGRSFVAYTDEIHVDTVLLYDFKLTAKGGRLKKSTVDALKSKYEEIAEKGPNKILAS